MNTSINSMSTDGNEERKLELRGNMMSVNILEDIYLINTIVLVSFAVGIKLIQSLEKFPCKYIILTEIVLIIRKKIFSYFVQIVIL